MRAKEGEVRLEKHNPRWRQMFAQELDELWDYFGDYAIRISHIGSTAIDNIEAKPIIDIVVAVKDLDDFSFVSHKFTSNPEYSIKNDFTNEEILIRKGDKNNRSFYIHVMDIDSKRYKDVIIFRDLLLHDTKTFTDYRNLKHTLATKYSQNRKKYTSTKSDFIEAALEIYWARTALIPAVVILAISLTTLIASIYMHATSQSNALIFSLSAISLSRIGMAFGAVCLIATALATIILARRLIDGRKKYNKITAKINRDIAKEEHKR